MKRRIRDLDFDAIIARVLRSTDAKRRIGSDPILNGELGFVHTPADAVRMLSNCVLIAVLQHTKKLEDLRIEKPMVQALVRIQHHPLSESLPEAEVEKGLRGPDASPRLTEIVDAHPELEWDPDAVQALILKEILASGDHELEDSEPPWLMHWDEASSAASALIALITLRAFGDL